MRDIVGWDLNPHDFEFNGTVTFAIEGDGHEENVIAGFVDGQVRGLAERMYFPFGDTHIYIMQIYSNVVDGEELTFKLYDGLSGNIVDFNESILFESDMVIGDGFAPLNLTDASEVMIPQISSLGSAYPNPFNPTTMVNFSVPTEMDVQVIVYDMMGRVISELANGVYDQGNYELHWDASQQSSGIYFVQMIAGSQTNIQKLMLVK